MIILLQHGPIEISRLHFRIDEDAASCLICLRRHTANSFLRMCDQLFS